jgi:hypothetical protein
MQTQTDFFSQMIQMKDPAWIATSFSDDVVYGDAIGFLLMILQRPWVTIRESPTKRLVALG